MASFIQMRFLYLLAFPSFIVFDTDGPSDSIEEAEALISIAFGSSSNWTSTNSGSYSTFLASSIVGDAFSNCSVSPLSKAISTSTA